MKSDNLLKASIAGIVRHVMTTVAGMLVVTGWIVESQTDTVVGIGLGVFGILWSVVHKWKQNKELS